MNWYICECDYHLLTPFHFIPTIGHIRFIEYINSMKTIRIVVVVVVIVVVVTVASAVDDNSLFWLFHWFFFTLPLLRNRIHTHTRHTQTLASAHKQGSDLCVSNTLSLDFQPESMWTHFILFVCLSRRSTIQMLST